MEDESKVIFLLSLILNQSDVDAVAEDCEISKEKAEQLLRKNQGLVKNAILSYINGN
jgi:hypothetical protein